MPDHFDVIIIGTGVTARQIGLTRRRDRALSAPAKGAQA